MFLKHWPFLLPALCKRILGFLFCFVFKFSTRIEKKSRHRDNWNRIIILLPLYYSYLRGKGNVLLGVFVLKYGVNHARNFYPIKLKLPINYQITYPSIFGLSWIVFLSEIHKKLPNSTADHGLRSFFGSRCFYKY